MEGDHSKPLFDDKVAASYDAKRERLAPIKDALHLCSRFFISELPENANILCVGVGTGAELIYLANEFPGWRFTAVDPSPQMLDVCRKRLNLLGLESRCMLYEGYIHELDNDRVFDGATSILVSQFLVDNKDRKNYFSEIYKRLRSGGFLINADIACNVSPANFQHLLDGWVEMHEYAEMTINTDDFGKKVSLLPVNEVESLILESGFDSAIHFYQAIFMHAWFCLRS